ncbi:PD-(D/E)XK nuclease family protein [Sphingomonas sp. Root241]|uniref:PD-(D/E)XK nuclease family protein n=1 Tax=Sphingomonas sp. Root241 TaxID=1736501 RepID=UPI000AEC2DA0|nr:PD-(D/E)XK nuclease family protein [Sphingomonas sp. Root241]
MNKHRTLGAIGADSPLTCCPPSLRDPALRYYDEKAVLRWAFRLEGAAKRAMRHRAELEDLVPSHAGQRAAIERFHGLGAPAHCFHVEPIRWFRPTEPQVTFGLQRFLAKGGSELTLSFLRALDPTLSWPEHLDGVTVEAEVPCKRGRIDLLISGKAAEVTWGAVVEAKFGHNIRQNPLPDYAQHAAKLGMQFRMPGRETATSVLIVLGQRNEAATRARLRRNRRWSFLNWHTFLRRWESELTRILDDDDFRRFRRTIWERAA